MPDFDNTLLALQGLSAGTYLGLKITEPKVTTVPDKPKAAETPPAVTLGGALFQPGFSPARIFCLNSAICEIVWLVSGRSTGSLRSADRSAAV